MENDNKRNLDDQLDEEQRENEIRTTAEELAAIGDASGAVVGDTLTSDNDQNSKS